MPSSPSTREYRRFAASVLLPVSLTLIVIAAGVLGFVFWSTANIDERALSRQTAMVAHVLSTRQQQVIREQGSVVIWDDALVNTKLVFNRNWVDANIGRWVHDFFGHNRAAVLDAANHPLYVMEEGIGVDAGHYAAMAPAAQPMIDRLRQIMTSGGLNDYNSGRANAPPAVTDFVIVDGTPSIISVMPIVSDSRALSQAPGSEPVMVTVLFLDKALSDRLTQEYLFEDAAFSRVHSDNPDKASYALLNNAGRFIAFFEWSRDRPGRTVLHHTGPVLAIAFLVGSVLVMLLLAQLRRSSAALEAGRVHAEHQAAHDVLTGLPNRMSFDRQLSRMLAEKNPPGTRLHLMMLDLDRFKQVNDTLGHQAGDELICAVGNRLKVLVGEDVLIARLGGDEFAILGRGQENPQQVLALAARIIDSIGQPFELGHFRAFVGVSIGVVFASDQGAQPSELIRRADIALYEAKSNGRNRAVVYEEQMNEHLQLQHTIEGELRDALRKGDQLAVVFQPLVDQRSRKVIGAEALARWTHPHHGQISPARFIPVAENTGLIESLGEFVLRRACELGAKVPGRTMAVNISPTQLRNPRFAAQVIAILDDTGMQPIDLELEITESILLDDEHISSQNLRHLRSAGIHIALDDFGTGYSSLSYLKRYPVDRIKIDRSFVNQLTQGHVSVAITQAIVTLAHAMDIEVTAEGVETEDQARILGRLGCNTLQGFLFSPAVLPERIEEIFATTSPAPKRRRQVA